MKVVKEEILLFKLVVDEYCQKLGRSIHLCLLPWAFIQETPIGLLVAASCNYSRFPTRPQQGMGATDLVLSESDCPIFVRSCELTNREEQETWCHNHPGPRLPPIDHLSYWKLEFPDDHEIERKEDTIVVTRGEVREKFIMFKKKMVLL
jgi:hypothetical protein